MIKQLLLFAFLIPAGYCFSQKPMHIKELRPKVDSIQEVARTLYAYEVSTKSAFQLSQKRNLVFSDYLAYQNEDSTFVLFLSDDQQCKLEYLFLNNYTKPTSTSTRIRQLNQTETDLVTLMGELVEKAEILSDDTIQVIEGTELHQFIVPGETQDYLYFITASEQDSIYPAGNDHLFVFNKDRELLNQLSIHFHNYSIKTEDQRYGNQLKYISHRFNKQKDLLPFALRILKFRIYHKNVGLSTLQIGWDRRSIQYDAKEDKVNIKLFYDEERSPLYKNM